MSEIVFWDAQSVILDDNHDGIIATVLLRDAEGRVSLRHVSTVQPEAREALAGRICRPGRPILDPQSREVMGYELEWDRAAH